MHRWWDDYPEEHFWLEITDRKEVGLDLHARTSTLGEVDHWSHALVDETKPGEIVFHYRKQEASITGCSVIAGPPHDRVVELADFRELSQPVSLEQLRKEDSLLKKVKTDLRGKVGDPIYFPFQVSEKRPPRLAEAYVTKLPKAIVDHFPWMGVTQQSSSSDPVHLLFKWNADVEPNTIELHRKIAESEGSVWWGRFAKADGPKVASSRIEKLRAQIEANVPTFAFLYRKGDLWKAELEEVTTEAPSAGDPRFPSYYQPSDCNFFVRLRDFQHLPASWANEHLTMASSGSILSALRNQTTPLFVRETEMSKQPDSGHTSDLPSTDVEWSLDLELVLQEVEARGLLIEDDVVLAILAALEGGKHVVLTGPPGTAKTTLAEAVASAANRSGLNAGYTLSTATSDWTTFETIGGLRPSSDGNTLVFSYGQFLRTMKSNHWLVVDEMNRSNFDRAFGQLFTVLSGQSVELPYADEVTGKPIKISLKLVSSDKDPFCTVIEVPTNWRMIATINVFDKSLLFEMSFALMRRFAFIEVPAPSQAVYEELIRRCAGPDVDEAKAVLDLLTPLFELRSVKELGPALFMDMARFVVRRQALGAISDSDLTFQVFFSYLLPQFEGINEPQAVQLRMVLSPLVGRNNKQRLIDTLRDVLGVDLGSKSIVSEDVDDEDE